VSDTRIIAPAHDAPAPAWEPLREPGFRAVWSALFGSQMVNWMHTVGAVTVIASLSGSATLIALVQTAVSLPAVLLALLAGAAADIVDRRRLVLSVQTWMVSAVAVLAVLVFADVVTPAVVLGLTFALGAGMATTILAFQAMTGDVVSRAELAPAVALNGVAINLARAAGPALAGVLVAALGAGGLFAIEAGALVFIMGVVFRLRLPERRRAISEDLPSAMRSGMRYVRFSRPLRAVLARGALYSICASALWSLLPVVAFGRLDMGSRGFGLLLTCVGVGAIIGAFVMPRVRARVPLDVIVAVGTVVVAAGLVVLAFVDSAVVVAAALVPTGSAWLAVMSSLNTSAQRVAADWVRGRAIASFQLVFQGGLAFGSLTWGVIAGTSGVRTALTIAAGGMLLGIVAGMRWPLSVAERPDMSPAEGWHEHELAIEPAPEDGPVLVMLEYDVLDERADDFVAAMIELGRARRRGGAYAWHLYEDPDQPGRYVETFRVRSWGEHLLQSERVTVADAELQRIAKSFHVGDAPTQARHLVSALGDSPRLVAGRKRLQ
jgi:MFS family permease